MAGDCMKGFYLIFFVIAAVALFCSVETLPSDSLGRTSIYQPVNWYVQETPGCSYGYQCRYGTWVPQITLNTPVWVFGITNQDQCGGVMNFRNYPDYPCQQSCSEYIPVSYMCEVTYVPFDGGEYLPEDVPVTYVPAGQYVVTSPSFSMHYNMRLWFFFDDGNGPKEMSVHLQTDNHQYGQEESVQVVLQVRDEDTGEYLQVDSISGVITLPDGTQKTVTEDWSWNDEESHYQYVWDFANDAGECSNPKEGNYTAGVYVKKKYYKDMRANSSFDVCFHVEINLEFDKDPPEYVVEEEVEITVYIRDENEEPIHSGAESILILPDGSQITDLEWTLADEGTYTTIYTPQQEGEYTITVGPKEDVKCCLEEASGTFYVGDMGEGEVSCSLSEEEISNLAHKYAPYMYFYKGFWGEEKYFPTRVEVMLQNSTFWKFGPDKSTKIDGYDYSAEFVGEYTDQDHYVDLNYEGCTIDSDLADEQGTLTMYYRVVCHRYEGKKYIVIQYRPFYIFNDFYNIHEGDWEMVEVLLDYYTEEPIGAAYSRHLDGEYRLWDDMEKRGTHPVVYVARGSHAAYFEEGIYYVLGLFFDFASDDGRNGLPYDYCLISETLGPPWLYFGGNWGYRVRRDEDDCSIRWFDAPRGPLYCRETWLDPVGWAFSKANNKSEILRGPYILFSLSSPADMLITNSVGQRLGFVDGEFVQEIPNSYVQNYGEKEAYVIGGIDEYKVEVFGTGEGVLDLACSVNAWDNTKTIKYCNVPVTPTTKAVFDLDSDLLLNVDTNRDGITDLTISPVSIQLLSSQSIKPLKIGEEMTYEVVLINQGSPSTFTLDVDTPLTWSYSLSSNTVTLNPGQSAPILLTVTSPQEIPLKDYTIRFEATSLEDSQMTANLDLIASSKPELAAETMTLNCKEEDVILTAFVSNVGLMDAENVKIQFFNGPPSENDLLGEKIIDVPSGELVTPSIRFALPDGLYAFYVVIDPDNSICESCEFNNELSLKYLLDRTPPEAEIFFNPEMENLVVRGIDNLDSSVDVSVIERVIKNKSIRTYTLTDGTGNTTELQLEIKQNRHEIMAEIVDMKYNGKPVALPQNSFRIEHVIKNSNIKMLNQYLIIGDSKMHLIYNQNKDQTKIIINGIQQIEEGHIVVVVKTNKGNLQHSIKNMRWVV
jgi:hypothetical protein